MWAASDSSSAQRSEMWRRPGSARSAVVAYSSQPASLVVIAMIALAASIRMFALVRIAVERAGEEDRLGMST